MHNQKLQIKYHPAKKEVLFKRIASGKEVIIRNDSVLFKYMNLKGKFVLQDYGNAFFDDIAATFDGETQIYIDVITTKTDFEDFQQMVEYYNQNRCIRIDATLLAKLPDMDHIYSIVKEHGKESITVLEKHRTNFLYMLDDDNKNEKVGSCIKFFVEEIQKEIDNIEEKIECMSDNSINLCFTGVYSTGKSALINAILGYKILPESMESETARMFRIKSPKSGEGVRIVFYIRNNHAELLWNEESKTFVFGSAPSESNTRKIIQETINNNREKHQHDQIYEIIKTLNTNNDIATEIKIFFPIPLDSDGAQFTIFDTPGTDSNYMEHKNVLQDALVEQTHSILIFVAAPNKTEGEGNNALLSYLKEAEKKGSKTSIDIGRSLFVMNYADSAGPDDRRALQKAIIRDKTDPEFSIKLSDKKLFFTSAKIAYAAKAGKNGIATKNDEFIIKQYKDTIRDEDFGRYYSQNRVATSECATKELVTKCDKALTIAESNDDINEVLRICSGLYALETEIVSYGRKYASAVRAYAIINSVDKALSLMNKNARSLKDTNQSNIEEVTREIENISKTISKGIKDAHAEYGVCNNKLNDDMTKELRLDSDSVEELKNKSSSKVGELKKKFLGRGKLKFIDKNKEKLTKDINNIIQDYITQFCENRQKSLEKTRDNFIEKVKDIVRNNGDIGDKAKDYVLQIEKPKIKPYANENAFGEVFNESKRSKKFLWLNTDYVSKEDLEKGIERKLCEISRKMTDDFKKDYIQTLTSVLNAIETEFTHNIEKYSILLQAKISDKKVMLKLGDKIQDTANALQDCQNKLNTIIWSVKNDN